MLLLEKECWITKHPKRKISGSLRFELLKLLLLLLQKLRVLTLLMQPLLLLQKRLLLLVQVKHPLLLLNGMLSKATRSRSLCCVDDRAKRDWWTKGKMWNQVLLILWR